MFLLGASNTSRCPGVVSLKHMKTPVFEETRPADYLTRAAASDLGKAYNFIITAFAA